MLHRIRTAALAATSLGATVIAAPAVAGGVEPLTTELAANLLRYPTGAYSAPGDYTRFYVTEKRGTIQVLNLKTGVQSAGDFLDIDSLVGGGGSTNDERGLLGLAFHPEWQTNRLFYVYYTANNGATVIAEYTAIDGETADPGSGRTIWTYSQPFTNHNGGWIGFGPDGYLYIASGDGGSGGDPGNRAQDITNQPLGKMHRIDVNGDDFPTDPNRNYAIPADNPFVGVIGDDEIWAYGLRNPWRSSFDMGNGDFYIADVGQNAREEINFQRSISAGGENYGWRCREGNANFNFSGDCANQTFTEPIHVYTHSQGFSVTGGYVYRGCAIPSLDGTYFFADYGTARIWSFDAGGGTGNFTVRTGELDPPGSASINRIASFAQDLRGEVYIIEHGTGFNGELWKIVPETPTVPANDLNCDGVVDFSDLLALLAQYGPCDGCLEDLDGNHAVDFNDILSLLASWS
ncbi:MAG: PQQ-dependent sugar dehydrogenase [Planctomycetota bacterium]|jgi:glucose/arabinose dehydrogenase